MKTPTMESFIASLKPGERVNVRRPCDWDDAPDPMIRLVKSAKLVDRNGKIWFYWYWETQGNTPEGKMDCGYSGSCNEEVMEAVRAVYHQPTIV